MGSGYKCAWPKCTRAGRYVRACVNGGSALVCKAHAIFGGRVPSNVAPEDAAKLRRAGMVLSPDYQAGRAEGRREALWLMAVGAACDEALEGCSDGMSTVLGIAYGNVSTQAIRALADLGDDNARRMLGGE